MALSASANLPKRNMQSRTRYTYTVLSGATCYKDGLIVLTAAGLAKPAANETTTVFAGLAVADTAAGDGSVTVTVINDIEMQITLATAVTVGNTSQSKIYAVDDASATTEATLGPEIGVMVEFTSANLGWIRLRQQPQVVAS